MAEYKDITKLKKEISDVKQELWESSCQNRSYITGYVSALSYVEGMIASLPTVDVEPIVTCKDCQYNGLHTCPIAYIEKQTLQFVNHDPDFWCAKGKRKK